MRFLYLVTLIPFIAVAQSKINICNKYGNALQDDIPGNVKQEGPLNNEMFRKISNKKDASLLLRYQCVKSECDYSVNIIVPKSLMSSKYEEVYYQNHFGRYNTVALDINLSNNIFTGGFQTTYHLKNISLSGLKVFADLMNKDQLVRSNFLVGKLDSAKPFFTGKKSGNLIFPGFPGGRITYKTKYWKITSSGEINVSDSIGRGDLDDLNACLVLSL